MKPSLLLQSRLFAWTSALGAVLILVAGYSALPDQIPLTRWTTVDKTLPLVLRIPLINLFCLLLVHVLERALVRAHGGSFLRENAMRVVAILYAVVGLKAILEAVELLALPAVFPWMLPVLLFILIAGFWAVATVGRPLVRRDTHPKAAFMAAEKAVLGLCVTAIVCLQSLPVWK